MEDTEKKVIALEQLKAAAEEIKKQCASKSYVDEKISSAGTEISFATDEDVAEMLADVFG